MTEPFYKDESVIIYHADCRDVLPDIGTFDLLLTDPPYGIDADNQARILSRGKLANPKDYGVSDWDGQTVFMNPPYGREIKDWLRKAYSESLKPGTRVVCLIPARTDTKYWHEYCMKAKEIHFVKGRLKFGGSANSAPFPSAVVVFESQPQTIIKTMEAR